MNSKEFVSRKKCTQSFYLHYEVVQPTQFFLCESEVIHLHPTNDRYNQSKSVIS
jgi:hypothetical protein